MKKHTPGPYLIDGNTIYALEHHGWRKGEETFHNRFYAYVYPERNCPSEEAEAVAKLFAAAPEMLEALRNVREELKQSGLWNAKDFGWPSNRDAISAAISRAEEG